MGWASRAKKARRAARAATEGANVPPTPSDVSLAPMGLPGQSGGHLVVVNQFKDPDDPRNRGGPVGVPGNYRVVFTLSRPGYALAPEYKHSFEGGLNGDSHLAISKPAFSPPGNPDATQIRIDGATDAGRFEFIGYPNEGGFLGKIEARVMAAANFNDAEQKSHSALAPSLSHWSIHLDVPLHVQQIDITELRTGNTRVTFSNPFLEVPFAVTPTATIGTGFRNQASLYREALESSSPVYRFLCFFKVMEGIRASRVRMERAAKREGKPFVRPTEAVPRTRDEFVPWLNAIFPIRPDGGWDAMAIESVFRPEILGRSFDDVYRELLRPLRDNIAHALFEDTGEITLSADDLLDHAKLNHWLPLTKCVVRRMLKNEFPDEFLSYLREDGTIGD